MRVTFSLKVIESIIDWELEKYAEETSGQNEVDDDCDVVA